MSCNYVIFKTEFESMFYKCKTLKSILNNLYKLLFIMNFSNKLLKRIPQIIIFTLFSIYFYLMFAFIYFNLVDNKLVNYNNCVNIYNCINIYVNNNSWFLKISQYSKIIKYVLISIICFNYFLMILCYIKTSLISPGYANDIYELFAIDISSISNKHKLYFTSCMESITIKQKFLKSVSDINQIILNNNNKYILQKNTLSNNNKNICNKFSYNCNKIINNNVLVTDNNIIVINERSMHHYKNIHNYEKYIVKSCNKCFLIRPDRSHHCSICNKCILKLDHHCPWVNNCIGFYNYKYFILMLFYVFTSCIQYIIVFYKFNNFIKNIKIYIKVSILYYIYN